ncbi:MAG: RIP metalloprotease [Actinobacteria bacterium]|nr:RIP metalloprotease [Actinomycetota bacterium]
MITAILALGFLASWGWAFFVVALIVMIFMHELGHYLTARWTGMKVTEFFIGFGPRLWSFRKGETEYGVKGIPAGAYVRIIGMNNLDPVEPGDEQRSYRVKSWPRKMLVVSAGSASSSAISSEPVGVNSLSSPGNATARSSPTPWSSAVVSPQRAPTPFRGSSSAIASLRLRAPTSPAGTTSSSRSKAGRASSSTSRSTRSVSSSRAS